MTCIVAVAAGDGIVMGADSSGGSLETGEIYTIQCPRKIIRTGPYLIGFTASFRLGQTLCQDKLPEPPTGGDLYAHMVSRFVPAVAALLRRDQGQVGEIWLTDTGQPLATRGCLAVAVGSRLFALTADLAVLDPGPFLAIGSGRHYAYGALSALGTRGTSAERVRAALTAAATYSPTVQEPFYLERLAATAPAAILLEGVEAGT